MDPEIRVWLKDIEIAIRQINDTRNRIIHAYDNISADVIWLIVTNDLPVLEREISYLLNS